MDTTERGGRCQYGKERVGYERNWDIASIDRETPSDIFSAMTE
jgi:hypothetical protein